MLLEKNDLVDTIPW